MADSGRGKRGGGGGGGGSVPAGYGRLVHHYVFYGAYHTNVVNQWIHIVCVPAILATALLMAHALSPPATTLLPAAVVPERLSVLVMKVVERLTGAPLSIATIAAAVYMAFYVYLTPTLLGLSAAALVFALFQLALAALPLLGAHAVTVTAVIHVVCWLAQFYGHGVHEKRAPALLDNLLQAIFMAPIFVYMEMLYKVGLLAGVHAAAASRIREERAKLTAVKP